VSVVVRVGAAVLVSVGVRVDVGVGVRDNVGVIVRVIVAVYVSVEVGEMYPIGVLLGVGVMVGVLVCVGLGPAVLVRVTVPETVGAKGPSEVPEGSVSVPTIVNVTVPSPTGGWGSVAIAVRVAATTVSTCPVGTTVPTSGAFSVERALTVAIRSTVELDCAI
jgi:hypothetical protein